MRIKSLIFVLASAVALAGCGLNYDYNPVLQYAFNGGSQPTWTGVYEGELAIYVEEEYEPGSFRYHTITGFKNYSAANCTFMLQSPVYKDGKDGDDKDAELDGCYVTLKFFDFPVRPNGTVNDPYSLYLENLYVKANGSFSQEKEGSVYFSLETRPGSIRSFKGKYWDKTDLGYHQLKIETLVKAASEDDVLKIIFEGKKSVALDDEE